MKAGDPLECDLLVLGSGIAGLRGGIEAARAGWRVIVATKDQPKESNTEYAQGGIAVPLADNDIERHFQDTLKAGDGLCKPAAVRVLVRDGRERVKELIDWGAEFDRNKGLLDYTREAAHSRNRILHAHGDATGRELERVLTLTASLEKKITVLPFHTGISLIPGDNGCRGAWVLDETEHRPEPIMAKAVLITTGGVGRLFQESTNPPVATGDGIAMALASGLVASNLEFVQFHPTVLFLKGAPRFLLSESMRGEGALLRNLKGERFMVRYDPAAELAPRDTVTRAVVSEIRAQGGHPVTLDMTGLDPAFVKERFPTIFATCGKFGIDISRDPIPVYPAAHYMMGGIETDDRGRSSMDGVYAAGEVACTGVHGANRLASNSLLEGLVFAVRAVHDALDRSWKEDTGGAVAPPVLPGLSDIERCNGFRHRIAALMWEEVGIIRSGGRLRRARVELGKIRRRLKEGHLNRRVLETSNMAFLGEAIAASAEYRKESRGAHYREDYPKTDDANWRRPTRLLKKGGGFSFPEASGV